MKKLLPAAAVLLACLLLFHSAVPNAVGHLGSLLETYLPWLGLGIPVLAGLALWRRNTPALIAVLLPAIAWLSLFAGFLLPTGTPAHDLVAVQHNINDENPDPAGTAKALLRANADLLALVEVVPANQPALEATLAPTYPHHVVIGTVGLWSKYPLADTRLVNLRPHDLGDDWNRGLRATATTPTGPVAVYVAHLPSVRLGPTGLTSGRRDESATLLGRALTAEALPRVILLGDFNSTLADRGLAPVTTQLTTPVSGFAFSWPATLPMAQIDHILTRTAKVTHLWALPATTSDHLPVAAHITL